MAKELTVAEANQGDVGRSVARIPSQAMDDLGIVPGDIITTQDDFNAAYDTVSTTKEDTDADN